MKMVKNFSNIEAEFDYSELSKFNRKISFSRKMQHSQTICLDGSIPNDQENAEPAEIDVCQDCNAILEMFKMRNRTIVFRSEGFL